MTKKEILFPYAQIRPVQTDFINAVAAAVGSRNCLIANAPTGLGKTIGALGPALAYALENQKTIFFLTSRHTQHNLAIETLRDIQEEYGTKINVVDIIGKRWMCPLAGKTFVSGDFSEYCKSLREKNECEYFSKTRSSGKLTVEAKHVMDMISGRILHTDKLVDSCKNSKVCPYEIALALAQKADVVVADYYYMFHPSISENFFSKAQKETGNCIMIVDEAHNLPARVRDLATSRLSTIMLKRAIKEAEKNGFSEISGFLSMLKQILSGLSKELRPGEEKKVHRDVFIGLVQKEIDYSQLKGDLEAVAEEIRARQKSSYIGGIAAFLEDWVSEDREEHCYARIISSMQGFNEMVVTMSKICLDPSIISKPVIENVHSTIMMSGTLIPTEMYRDLMGFEKSRTDEKVFGSPFPQKNRLNLLVPNATTKFTSRSTAQYENIAAICGDIANSIPGNSIMFFPSYHFRDYVLTFFQARCKKTVFCEKQKMTKEDKTEMLERFKQYKGSGAVLLAVASGSFSEGVDLPGDLLKGVVVVGLPLQSPDLETKELINYYDRKFGKGWDYGYIFPAFNRVLQSAGRCIRSETDKGIIVFLDERYLWPKYFALFPPDWKLKISRDYVQEIKGFFDSFER